MVICMVALPGPPSFTWMVPGSEAMLRMRPELVNTSGDAKIATEIAKLAVPRMHLQASRDDRPLDRHDVTALEAAGARSEHAAHELATLGVRREPEVGGRRDRDPFEVRADATDAVDLRALRAGLGVGTVERVNRKADRCAGGGTTKERAS